MNDATISRWNPRKRARARFRTINEPRPHLSAGKIEKGLFSPPPGETRRIVDSTLHEDAVLLTFHAGARAHAQ